MQHSSFDICILPSCCHSYAASC